VYTCGRIAELKDDGIGVLRPASDTSQNGVGSVA